MCIIFVLLPIRLAYRVGITRLNIKIFSKLLSKPAAIWAVWDELVGNEQL